jgi:hypothetical protein
VRGVAMRLCGLGVGLDYLGVGTVVQLECSEGRSLVLFVDLFTSLLFLWQFLLIPTRFQLRICEFGMSSESGLNAATSLSTRCILLIV